eukprot:CAMPEP_0119207618 /NCGR_PEP_ID=MMETSP1327-20130426/77_1 /TAXON_ID=38833 /ORGANISM="Micromonas pusilla, Strain RCC2306" /LENGTH=170 /DNA_ID=CAMNT_0007204027 /DNA_START=17 /DNA_END=529 /DNA_ORIENTATION=+
MSAPLRRAATLSVRAAFRPTVGVVQWNPVRTTIAPAAKLTPPFNGASRGFASDSDDDFKPTTHVSGASAIQAAIAKDVAENKVLLYMKGTPSAPQCGFSNMAVQILNSHGVEYATRNVLASEDTRNGIKEFSSWPTIPQVFIHGEFVGGCDILRQMHADGELEKTLKTAQ